MSDETSIVTGAYSFTGKFIARKLLALGRRVKTLTSHPPAVPSLALPAGEYDFDQPALMAEFMHGATTLYNTYWIRFERRQMSFAQAIDNTGRLLEAAAAAGVRRIVHVSITNPAPDSPYPYFRGKAVVEGMIMSSGMSFAILRPALLFGEGDVLINNIAWHLRHFPLFAIFGDGLYPVQPTYVEDLAELAVRAGQEESSSVADAVGPDKMTFQQMVTLIRHKAGGIARLMRMSAKRAFALTRISGRILHDVVLTREEVDALMTGLLASDEPPLGWTSLADWLTANAGRVGRGYVSELRRHYDLPVMAK